MDRQEIVENAFQKGKELHLRYKNYRSWLKTFFDKEYTYDVGAGDITSKAILAKNKSKKAILKAKESGVVGRIEEVNWFLRKHRLEVKNCTKDAQWVLKGETILEVHGGPKDILATERIA